MNILPVEIFHRILSTYIGVGGALPATDFIELFEREADFSENPLLLSELSRQLLVCEAPNPYMQFKCNLSLSKGDRLACAAIYGQLHIIEAHINRDFTTDQYRQCIDFAVANKRLEVALFLCKNSMGYRYSVKLEQIIRNDYVELLPYVKYNDTYGHYLMAIKTKSLKVIGYLLRTHKWELIRFNLFEFDLTPENATIYQAVCTFVESHCTLRKYLFMVDVNSNTLDLLLKSPLNEEEVCLLLKKVVSESLKRTLVNELLRRGMIKLLLEEKSYTKIVFEILTEDEAIKFLIENEEYRTPVAEVMGRDSNFYQLLHLQRGNVGLYRVRDNQVSSNRWYE